VFSVVELMKIAIGPLIRNEYGGMTQHIINIIKHSKNRLEAIRPSPLSIYYSSNKFKLLAEGFLIKCRIERGDPYGMFLSKMLSSHFDIVHLHGHPYWPAIYCKPKKGARYVHTVHQIFLKEDSLNQRDWSYQNWLNELMLKSCRESDAVISVAKWQQKLLSEKHVESIHIPNGVSIKECGEGNPQRFRERYVISEQFLLFASRIDKYKRPELFVELARKMPDKLFVMTGAGVTLENLKAYLRTSVPKNIICLDNLPRRDIIDAFTACEVFVLPSKNETFGIALLEAMGCKKPVVAANNAGPKEIVTHGKDGLLFEPDDIEDLHEKVCIGLGHPEVGSSAFTLVKEKYDWTVVIKQIDNLYKKLV